MCRMRPFDFFLIVWQGFDWPSGKSPFLHQHIYVGGIFPYIPIIKTTIYVNAHGFFNSNVPEIWPTEIA